RGDRLYLCPVDRGRPALAALGGSRRVHRRRDHRLSRRLLCEGLESAIGLRADARSDRRQAAGRLVPVDARRGRHYPRLVAVGGDRDPVPRNPGVGPARISRRAPRQRTRHQACEMEDHDPARCDRLPARGRSRRPRGARRDPDRTAAALDLRDLHDLHRLGLFPPRHPPCARGGWRMKVKYFAWVRERVGKAEETIEPPANVRTVDDLIAWLSARDDFDVAREITALSQGRTDIGAVVTFSGICRGPEGGNDIASLTLEHYRGMAEAE